MSPRGASTAVPTKLFPEIGPVSEAVLFHGVPGAPLPPTDPASWERELPVLLAEGLAGMALAAIDGGADRLRGVADALRDAHRAEIAMSRVAEAWAPLVLEHLRRDGVPTVVVKGPVVAQFYPESRLRPFEDIDVLVPPERFRPAIASLARQGFTVPVSPRDFFFTRCREGVNLGRADGASIDLHHRITPWTFTQRLTFDRVQAGSTPLSLGRGVVQAASPLHNLLIAALQIVGHRAGLAQKLKAWRDVHELAGHCAPDEAAREARDVGLGWFLALVLREIPAHARPNELARALGDVRPTRTQAARLRHLVPPSIGARNYSVGRLFRLPMANGISYIFAKTVPSGRFLRQIYGSRWAYPAWWRNAQEHLLESAAFRPTSAPNRPGEGSDPTPRDPNSLAT